jgi:hypothetical protein
MRAITSSISPITRTDLADAIDVSLMWEKIGVVDLFGIGLSLSLPSGSASVSLMHLS